MKTGECHFRETLLGIIHFSHTFKDTKAQFYTIPPTTNTTTTTTTLAFCKKIKNPHSVQFVSGLSSGNKFESNSKLNCNKVQTAHYYYDQSGWIFHNQNKQIDQDHGMGKRVLGFFNSLPSPVPIQIRPPYLLFTLRSITFHPSF